jgi:hypothetical protein
MTFRLSVFPPADEACGPLEGGPAPRGACRVDPRLALLQLKEIAGLGG